MEKNTLGVTDDIIKWYELVVDDTDKEELKDVNITSFRFPQISLDQLLLLPI